MKIEKWGKWNDIFFRKYPNKTIYTKQQEKCVIDEIRKKGYKFSGDYHQDGDYGVPYFEDGTPFMVSKREWGLIMADAWPEDDFYSFFWDMSELDNIYVYPTERNKND